MDGNGRWAQSRGKNRSEGHLEGLQTAQNIVKAASDRGLSYLTLYTFSTENWTRTVEEVGFLMGLIRDYLKKELSFCLENRIKVRHAGDPRGLPADIMAEINETCEATKDFTGLQVILALNYGGRDEIVRAIRRLTEKGLEASEEAIAAHLDNPDIPDPDLIIRSAGEYRMSNFLLWESAYAEFYTSPKYWPDWTGEDLDEAIEAYAGRQRKFGGVKGKAGQG
ncbi:MAG: polyprenyl diphosphate synthase [Treponema sp.]|nr:polyprenyl diphosphate synthase [Treponema sp.]